MSAERRLSAKEIIMFSRSLPFERTRHPYESWMARSTGVESKTRKDDIFNKNKGLGRELNPGPPPTATLLPRDSPKKESYY